MDPQTLEAITGIAPGLTWPVGKRGPLPLSHLRLVDYAALNAHLKALPLDAVKFALRDAPADQVRFMLRTAYAEVQLSLHDVHGEQIIASLRTVPGRAFALWRSLRRQTPDVTLPEVEDSLTLANFEEAGRLVDLVSGFPPARPDDPKAGAPVEAGSPAPSTGAASSV